MARKLALDLGATRVRAALAGRGRSDVMVDEPAVVALERHAGRDEVVATGEEALEMLGRTPENVRAVHPVREGRVEDFAATEALLREVLGQCSARFSRKPQVAVCVPAGATEVEQRSFQESARAAGAKEVTLVPAVAAAALGAGLPILEPQATMVVDLGGGTTEAAVFALGGLVASSASPLGGDRMDASLAAWLLEHRGLQIGERSAEALKRQGGCAVPMKRAKPARVRGRDLNTGMPAEAALEAEQVRAALVPVLDAIVAQIADTLARTPPELAGDLLDHGVVLCGGVAKLRGLERLLRDRLGLPCVAAEHPEHAAVLGAVIALDHPELLDRLSLSV